MSGKARWSARWRGRFHLARAFAWTWFRKPDRAVRALDAVEAEGGLSPSWQAPVLALRARLLDALDRRQEAEAAMAASVALQPKSAEPHRAYAELLTTWGRLEEAGRELRLAKELGPVSPRLEKALAAHAAAVEEKGRR